MDYNEPKGIRATLKRTKPLHLTMRSENVGCITLPFPPRNTFLLRFQIYLVSIMARFAGYSTDTGFESLRGHE